MRELSETFFKILAIVFFANGLQGVLSFFVEKTIHSGPNYDTPPILYFASALPLLIGALIWVLSSSLARATKDEGDALTVSSAVCAGCFLIGLYFVASNLPSFIFTLTSYIELSKIEIAANSFAKDKLEALKIISSRLVVGLLLIVFSTNITKAFMVLRRYGQQ
jgi:hypothetical protein